MRTSLEAQLRELRPEFVGDWDDVLARVPAGKRERRSRWRLVLVFAALALLLVVGSALAIGSRVFGWFAVSKSPREVPTHAAADVAYVAGDRLHVPGRPDRKLAAPVLAPFLGTNANLAVPSPGGRFLVYHAAKTFRVPLLRVHDLRTGRDRVLARGARSFAWRRDGRIAYFQAERPRYDGRRAYVGHVVVRNSLTGRGAVWTPTAAKYVVVAWARNRLLVSVERCLLADCPRKPEPGLYALDRPGELVPLPISDVSALSPEGRYAVGPFQPFGGGSDNPTSLIRVVDVLRGRVITTFDLAAAARARGLAPAAFLTGLATPASWRGGEIVGISSGGNASQLVFFRVSRGRVHLEDILRIPRSVLRVRYGVFYGPPAFAGRGTRRVVVGISGQRAGGGGAAAVLTCDRVSRRCVRGKVLRPRQWFAVVTNQSRPRR